jgi:DNA-3-methyladenine glycosylase II
MSRSRDSTRLGGSSKRKSRSDPHAAIRRELSARHPRLARMCELAHPVERVIPDERPLSHLIVRTIVGQLVSTAAARSIMATLLKAHGDIDGIIAWAMVTPEDAPPSHSLSRAKRKAIAHWGFFLAARGDPREQWRNLGADELVAEIMALRGLGRWSAHMIAIFGFGHPEIWPDGDAGVMRAARVVFKGMRQPTIRRLIRGHESHVALCCWTLLDKGRLADFEKEQRTSKK